MATYQDGRIWRKTLNAYLKRLNQHDWIGEKQEINGCMCWMTPPEVHPIVHNTSCPEYFKCKQVDLIIGLYACADLLYIYKGDRALQVVLCHHSIVLYSWLLKQSYLELPQFM